MPPEPTATPVDKAQPKRTHHPDPLLTVHLPNRVRLNGALVLALHLPTGWGIELEPPRRHRAHWQLVTGPLATGRLTEDKGMWRFTTNRWLDPKYFRLLVQEDGQQRRITGRAQRSKRVYRLGPEVLDARGARTGVYALLPVAAPNPPKPVRNLPLEPG